MNATDAQHPARNSIALSSDEYAGLCEYLERSCGLVLGPGKEYLIRSRLGLLLNELELADFAALLRRLHSDSGALRDRVLDAMTTHETYWFREAAAIASLMTLIAGRAGSPAFRVLSAGCSSGQEPYSLSMAYSELRAQRGAELPELSILGVDVSSAAIELARSARYPRIDMVRGLDDDRRQSFFRAQGDHWILTDAVRRRVEFRCFNLLSAYAGLGRFDAVFCRNVLIYFAPVKRGEILRAMTALLKPGGYLFLGSAESLPKDLPQLSRQHQAQCIYYRRH